MLLLSFLPSGYHYISWRSNSVLPNQLHANSFLLPLRLGFPSHSSSRTALTGRHGLSGGQVYWPVFQFFSVTSRQYARPLMALYFLESSFLCSLPESFLQSFPSVSVLEHWWLYLCSSPLISAYLLHLSSTPAVSASRTVGKTSLSKLAAWTLPSNSFPEISL